MQMLLYTTKKKSSTKDDKGNFLTENDVDAFAKRQIVVDAKENRQREYFWVKIDDTGHFADPNSQIPNRHPKFLSSAIENKDFVKVKAEVFNHYLTFLKTQNSLHLTFAERAHI